MTFKFNQEHAVKVETKMKDDNYPKLRGMTARQKHEQNLKQEKERQAQSRADAAGKSFFCAGQASAIAADDSCSLDFISDTKIGELFL